METRSEVRGSDELLSRMAQVATMGGRCAAFQWDYDVGARQVAQTAVPGVEYLWVVRECGSHLFVLGVGSTLDRRDRELPLIQSLARNYGDDHADWFHARIKAGSSVLCGINAMRAVSLVADSSQRIAQRWHSEGPLWGHLELTTSKGGFAGTAVLRVKPQTPESHGRVVDVAVELAEGLSVSERMYATLEVELRALMLAGSLFFRFGEYTVNGMCVSEARGAWLGKYSRSGELPVAACANSASTADVDRDAMKAVAL